MTESNVKRFPNLGQLSIALLENLVRPVLGEKAVDEIKTPLIERDLRDKLSKALELTEKRFIAEYSDKLICKLVLNLPLHNIPTIFEYVRSFYLKPTDTSLANALQSQIESDVPNVSKERIQVAVSKYLRILRDELANLPGEVRDKLNTIATLSIQDNTSRMADSLEKIEQRLVTNRIYFPKTLPSEISQDLPNIPEIYLNILATNPIETLWNNEPMLYRSVIMRREVVFNYSIAKPNTSARKQDYEETKSLEEMLRNELRLILLGDPGMGKTTSLQNYAKKIASESLEKNLINRIIPIYLELRTYRGEGFETWITEQIEKVLRRANISLGNSIEEREYYVNTWLRSSKNFALLFDGLNEVHPSYHAYIRDELKNWLKYPYQVVISCREHEYDDSLSRFAPAYILAGLGDSEIKEYLKNRLGGVYDADEWYVEEIIANEKLVSLATNPFMLRLIVDIALSRPNVSLPENRGILFQQFVRIMSVEKAIPKAPIPFGIVEMTLSQLAYEMNIRGILRVDLSEVLNWNLPSQKPILEMMEQAVQWRFLKSDGQLNEPIEFFHQLFQEYFSAVNMANQIRSGLPLDKVIINKHFEDNWQESIIMLSSMIPKPDEMSIWLSSSHVNNQKQIKRAVIECLKTTDAKNNPQACKCFAEALVNDLLISDEPNRLTLSAIHYVRQYSADPLRHALGNANEKGVWHISAGLLMARESPAIHNINILYDIDIPEKPITALIALAYGLSREDYLHAREVIQYWDQGVAPLTTILSKSKVSRVRTSIVYSLGYIVNNNSIRDILSPFLEDEDEKIREAVKTVFNDLKSFRAKVGIAPFRKSK